MATIEEKKVKRFQFLRKLYELSGGDESKLFDMFQIGEDMGFDRNLTENLVQYLEGEGLIKAIIGGSISITHWGIREVEEV